MLIELAWPAAALIATLVVSAAASRAWQAWIELRRYQIAMERGGDEADPSSRSRIEMAAIKERLRKLEEIATGVDL